MVRGAAGVVAGLLAVLAGAVDSSVSRPLSLHLLLLSRRVLQSVLGRPAACSVGEPRKGYLGENSFPLILQNVHRYFFYIAVIFIGLLAYEAWLAMWFTNATTGAREFGIGLGTLVLVTNVVLLACYTFGCHSGRHVFGGRRDVSIDLAGRQRLL